MALRSCSRINWVRRSALDKRMKSATSPAVMVATSMKARVSFQESDFRISVRFLQAVTDPEYRLHVTRVGRVELDLGAQGADVNVEGAIQAGETVAGQLVHQLGPGEDPAREAQQDGQQPEFDGGQGHRLAAH